MTFKPILNWRLSTILKFSQVARDAHLMLAILAVDNKLDEQSAAAPSFSISEPLHVCYGPYGWSVSCVDVMVNIFQSTAQREELYHRCSSFSQVGCLQRNSPSGPCCGMPWSRMTSVCLIKYWLLYSHSRLSLWRNGCISRRRLTGTIMLPKFSRNTSTMNFPKLGENSKSLYVLYTIVIIFYKIILMSRTTDKVRNQEEHLWSCNIPC